MKIIPILLAICVLFACSTVKRSVDRSDQQVKKQSTSETDTYQHKAHDSIAISVDSSGSIKTADSTYSRETTEDIIEWIVVKDSLIQDSSILIPKGSIAKKTTRNIKERGRLQTGSVQQTKGTDSTRIKDRWVEQKRQLQLFDSTGSSSAKNSFKTRKDLFPWWVWLILAGAGGIAWWKRGFLLFNLFGHRSKQNNNK